MEDLEAATALVAGGWDVRWSVVLAVATNGDVAAALIDANGDGADVNHEAYLRTSGGGWEAGSSGGGAGDDGLWWTRELVVRYGRREPGQVVVVRYLGEHSVVANGDGWWLFVAPTLDDHTMPTLVG